VGIIDVTCVVCRTDNGGYFYSNNPLNETEAIKLFHGFSNDDVPIAYLQLDDYWYPDNPITFSPDPKLYPNGLNYLVENINVPLLLYSSFWTAPRMTIYYCGLYGTILYIPCGLCGQCEVWSMGLMGYGVDGSTANGTGSAYNLTFVKGGPYHVHWAPSYMGQPAPQSSYSFYSRIFNETRDSIGAFEVDFLDFDYEGFSNFTSNVYGERMWFGGMADAALEYKLPVQICMALPAQTMYALEFPGV